MKTIIFVLGFLFSNIALSEIVSDQQILAHASRKNFFNPQLALAIAKVESSQNSKAKNEDHYGLMQIKAGTARMLGYQGAIKGLFDWRLNLDLAIQYLTEKYEEYQQIPPTVAAYNAGTVYICRTGKSKGLPCAKGRYINQEYVDLVLRTYHQIPPFRAIQEQLVKMALQDST